MKRKDMDNRIRQIGNDENTYDEESDTEEWNPRPSEKFMNRFEALPKKEIVEKYARMSRRLKDMMLNHRTVKLLKNQYGLKQGAANWYNDVDGKMKDFGFKRASCDHCLYWIRTNELTAYVILYVDDMFLFTNS